MIWTVLANRKRYLYSQRANPKSCSPPASHHDDYVKQAATNSSVHCSTYLLDRQHNNYTDIIVIKLTMNHEDDDDNDQFVTVITNTIIRIVIYWLYFLLHSRNERVFFCLQCNLPIFVLLFHISL